MTIIDVLFDLPVKLTELTEVLFDFLFTTVDLFGIEVSFWGILGGIGVALLIVYSIVTN